ncbi:MAG: hypothetical protein U1C33_00455, partial [Candidatus Cloacimonadaceae bacterium]|nr:hypothetical protein [Candidatus Cloacimonadaceae bacterium]
FFCVLLSLFAQNPALDTIYKNPEGKFTMRYPSSWVIDTDQESLVFFSGPTRFTDPQTAPSIEISISGLPHSAGGEDTESIIKLLLPYYQDILEDQGLEYPDIKDLGLSMINGHKYYSLVIDGILEGNQIRCEQHFALYKQDLMMITMTSLSEEYEDVKPVFKAVLNTITLKGDER